MAVILFPDTPPNIDPETSPLKMYEPVSTYDSDSSMSARVGCSHLRSLLQYLLKNPLEYKSKLFTSDLLVWTTRIGVTNLFDLIQFLIKSTSPSKAEKLTIVANSLSLIGRSIYPKKSSRFTVFSTFHPIASRITLTGSRKALLNCRS